MNGDDFPIGVYRIEDAIVRVVDEPDTLRFERLVDGKWVKDPHVITMMFNPYAEALTDEEIAALPA